MHIPKSPAEARLKRKEAIISDDLCGAENETRTRDPNLGKVVLYQLSYFRNLCRRTFPFFSIGIAKIWIISLSPKFFHRQRHKQRYNHDRLRLSTIILLKNPYICTSLKQARATKRKNSIPGYPRRLLFISACCIRAPTQTP